MHLARLLPHHLIRILVLSDSKKDRLAEAVIPRPLREFYLANHCRFDPMATLHFGSSQPLIPATSAGCWQVKKGTFFNPNFVEI